MKTKESIFALSVVTLMMIISSCSSSVRQTVDVKPITTTITGELAEYLEVVGGTYSINKIPEKTWDGGYDYSIEVKLLAKETSEDQFNDMSSTYLELTDIHYYSFADIDKFQIDDYDKLYELIKQGGEMPITFKWHADAESIINKNGLPPADSIMGFTISSEGYNQTASTRKYWQDKVDEYCKLSYEDIDIMKGKKKVSWRYRDELLDKMIDLEDEINYDLDKLTEEQVKQFEKATKDYEDYTNRW